MGGTGSRGAGCCARVQAVRASPFQGLQQEHAALQAWSVANAGSGRLSNAPPSRIFTSWCQTPRPRDNLSGVWSRAVQGPRTPNTSCLPDAHGRDAPGRQRGAWYPPGIQAVPGPAVAALAAVPLRPTYRPSPEDQRGWVAAAWTSPCSQGLGGDSGNRGRGGWLCHLVCPPGERNDTCQRGVGCFHGLRRSPRSDRNSEDADSPGKRRLASSPRGNATQTTCDAIFTDRSDGRGKGGS